MKIKHEHIRMAMNVWAHPDGEKVPAAKITKVYFELGMTFPELYDDSGDDSNLLIVFYVQIMPDDLVMQLHRF
ncbi:putative prophage protein [Escherichia coli]|nr:putative prophage protein [Escherichia coli]